MDYKPTLNLPKTSFPMKANLPQSEPKVLAVWEQDRLYQKMVEARVGGTPFILHDGPPYANGDIHMGHALNKVLKDIIVRYRLMRGYHAPYVPGWDCHGLPIEYALMKKLNITKHQVDVVEFRKQARAYAQEYVGIQREQFKRLGVIGDWEHPYLTLEPGYVATALRALSELAKKGFIYRERKPVNWCWSCETALAEAEVEYEQHESPSIYVKFELAKEFAGGSAFLVIWTTTPWTLFGNVAAAVHPNFEYAARKGTDGQVWITLSHLSQSAKRDLNGEKLGAPIKKFSGKELEGLAYKHPLGLADGKVVLADYVSAEDGTGLVHTAPGFGAEDYRTGKKYGLEVLAPVDSQGKFAGLPDVVKQFNGLQVQQANPQVIELLEKSGLLIHAGKTEHQYPHCWRCRNPIIFRATDQWFLNVEKENLRDRLLAVAEKQVRWIPPEGKDRMAGMLRTRPDWCLSRQRLWGIPIPAVVCEKCGEGILDPRVIEKFAVAAEQDPAGLPTAAQAGSDRWFSQPVADWLPEGFACRCGSKSFKRGTDILDVWFDSGVSHRAVLARRSELTLTADLYLEGSDQHRGWFQVSLITGVALNGKAPYRGVLTHGFVVDGEGRKMSKSLGNVMAPQEVVATSGADVLRLWVASSDYREDVRLSKEILVQMAEVYRKIRNTLRFMLANLSDFKEDAVVPQPQMDGLDRWVLCRLGGLVEKVTQDYEEYAFHRAVKRIHEFCTVELSNFYLDVVKDRLYTFHPDDRKRRSSQTALFKMAHTLIALMAPMVPMTAEEAWGALGKGSVHLASWPSPQEFPKDAALEETWQRLLTLRDQVMKALEESRAKGEIGDPLEADVEVAVSDKKLWEFLSPLEEDLKQACVVSDLRLTKAADSSQPVTFTVRKSASQKCQRCWMRLATVGTSAEHPGLCHRCVDVVKKLTPPPLLGTDVPPSQGKG